MMNDKTFADYSKNFAQFLQLISLHTGRFVDLFATEQA